VLAVGSLDAAQEQRYYGIWPRKFQFKRAEPGLGRIAPASGVLG